jgi:branched-chain amino acid aminotransferase
MLDMQGYVAETNATHVFIVERGAVSTSHTTSCPEGITRECILEMCRRSGIPCHERNITLAEVYRADEMFCTGTMGELVPVTEVDGRQIGHGRPGPVFARLARSFGELTAREGVWVANGEGRNGDSEG